MKSKGKRLLFIAGFIILILLLVWVVYNAGFWVGAEATRTTP